MHELYQSFFPPDVHYVADHAKRAMSRFPLCDGYYYGVNYGERARGGVPSDENAAEFYAARHICAERSELVRKYPGAHELHGNGIARRLPWRIRPRQKCRRGSGRQSSYCAGKKQWTWGNHPFGYAWDRNLTDEDGPYIELMAGVYTDNQPDFSFLAPGETKISVSSGIPFETLARYKKPIWMPP